MRWSVGPFQSHNPMEKDRIRETRVGMEKQKSETPVSIFHLSNFVFRLSSLVFRLSNLTFDRTTKDETALKWCGMSPARFENKIKVATGLSGRHLPWEGRSTQRNQERAAGRSESSPFGSSYRGSWPRSRRWIRGLALGWEGRIGSKARSTVR